MAILLLLVKNENGKMHEGLGIVVTVIILLSLRDIFAASVFFLGQNVTKKAVNTKISNVAMNYVAE